MPLTPFHMGPGAAIKAVTGRYFSLSVFGFAQIVIDSEQLVRILRGDAILHGVSHTYIGALFIGGFCLFAGRYACQGLFKAWNFMTSHRYLSWLNIQPDISWIAASAGAFFGTFSMYFSIALCTRICNRSGRLVPQIPCFILYPPAGCICFAFSLE